MKLQRFYVAFPISDCTQPVRIPSLELLGQLKRVLRMSPGDAVTLFDGSGFDYLATIDEYGKDYVAFTVSEKRENKVTPQRETWLFAAIVKKDNFEWIVEKATELGVSHIVPIISARAEKKDLNIERLTKVSIEAAEQSGRGTVPKIHGILKLAEAIATYGEQKGVVWEPTAVKYDKDDMNTIVSTWIGPEGGWTKEELELFKKSQLKIASLGPQILRAETAVIATLSQVVF